MWAVEPTKYNMRENKMGQRDIDRKVLHIQIHLFLTLSKSVISCIFLPSPNKKKVIYNRIQKTQFQLSLT